MRRRKRRIYYRTRKPSTLGRVLGGIMVCLCGVLVGSKAPTELERVYIEGAINVLSQNGPTSYYEGPDGYTGFEYALTKAFAEELGVELKIHDRDSLASLLDSVGTASGQLGASGLTITPERSKQVRFSSPYLEITHQLLYRSGNKKPTSAEDLVGKDVLIIANSAHAELMRELQSQIPALRWRERNDLELIDLVEMVHNGDVQHAIVDSNAYAINRRIYPKARAAFEFEGTQQLAWAFPRQQDSTLYDAAQAFFQRIESDGTLDDIRERYYGHVGEVNNNGALLFANRIKKRLPKWEKHLKAAAELYDLDWQLLAAISYQESHWNAGARSYTGVRGLMMLTQATARDMGVSNRIDPMQSIYGGAKYFKKILKRIPQTVQGPDRIWLALAAYNVGYGHLEDARRITQKHNGDPNKWKDVKEFLPLLTKRKYYRTTKHGYARGWEPVRYVQHIRNFYNILAWQDYLKQRSTTIPGNNTDYEQATLPYRLNLSLSTL